MSTILIIEDEVEIAQYIQFSLKHFGHDTAIAYDGLEASHLLPTVQPSTILLDLHLPYVDGFELLDQIKQLPHLADTKVVLMSGWSDLPAKVIDQADLVLTKPISLATLRTLETKLNFKVNANKKVMG